MDIQVFVAAHKAYKMPKSSIYQPIFVGSDVNGETPAGFQPDNDGVNISNKNPNYNELTAIFWAWKNSNADVKGLVHYRRYLAEKPQKKMDGILNRTEIEKLLKEKNVILPKKRHYYVESNYSHYIHAHQQEPLDVMRVVVQELYPDYLASYDLMLKQTSAHMFNMFIMPREYFDKYAEWLFSILFEVEKRIDISNYDATEARVFGYLSELLLDVWLAQNKVTYFEVPVMYLEGQQLVAKGVNLLKRKFLPNSKKKTHF